MDKRLEKIEAVALKLKSQMFGERADITDVMKNAKIRHKIVAYGHRKDLFDDYTQWEVFEQGGLWGAPDGHELFRVQVTIPDKFEGKEVFFFLSTGADDIWNTDNPQMLVYINGVRRSGMDMNHNCVSIYTCEDWKNGTDRDIDITIYAYSNLSQNGNYLKMELASLDEAAKNAYFDLSVPLDAAKAMLGLDSRKNAIDLLSDKVALKEVVVVDQAHAEQILGILEAACKVLSDIPEETALFTQDSMGNFSKYLHENLYGIDKSDVVVASTGHTHIDVAWKWPIRQTREKVIRSFSTVMELMKRYQEYLFMSSTPQLYEFVREDEPELFEEIKDRVKEGRFEPEGAMWLEADCNLTSGESLVRQILYGKRYFKEVFNKDSDILWLPDVFGYSAAMPQILKKSGIRAFVTTKLAWNDTNRMPHDLFMWKGIDGTSIPTYLITTCDLPRAELIMRKGGILNYTYNGRQDASQIMGTWRVFREKELTNETLTVYGFGDGGGGPTWEMLEMDRRLREGVPGCPVTVQKSVTEFMDGLLDNIQGREDVPVWEDELYLEFHRGTYTSMGKNKRNNRKLEILLQEAETLAVLDSICNGKQYPREELRKVWNILMLNQFHDILPGSSIEEVYKDSDEDYKKAFDIVKSLIKNRVTSTYSEKKEYEYVNFDEEQKDFNGFKLETSFYVISFDKNAEIVSIYDKEAGREVRDLRQAPLNRLIAFRDVPKEYDAWNIDADFEDVSWDITDLQNVSVCYYGIGGKVYKVKDLGSDEVINPHFDMCVDVTRKFRDSVIKQRIILRYDDRRIDFRTEADWHEHQVLLKAAFPVNLESKEISCEIQYGAIKRSLTRENSWDKAKFECCAHRWMDIADELGAYGVAVLNDCKYGYDAKEKLMRLTLIKSGIFPNPNADQGIHRFTYSLLPHLGDLVAGKVIDAAEALNVEEHCYLPDVSEWELYEAPMKRAGIWDGFWQGIRESAIEFDAETGIYVDAIKLAEDSEDVIIRLHEAFGRSLEVEAVLFRTSKKKITVKEMYECDLMEDRLPENGVKRTAGGNAISFAMKPYEIKTIRIKIK